MPSKYLPIRARGSLSCLLAHLRLLFHPHGISPLRGIQNEWHDAPSCAAGLPDQSYSLPLEVDLSSVTSLGTPPERLVDAVRNLKLFLLIDCELLGQGDLKIIGSRPIDASGFADVWFGEMNDGTTVAIKSLRYYSASSCLSIYLRLCKEALICSRLNDNKSFASLIGVYSTLEHPFALVFKFMDHMNLRRHLRNNQGIGTLELLLEIARDLKFMHSLGIVHGNLDSTNILVGGDGRVHIAGLGTASILSTDVPAVDIDPPFHGAASELIDPRQWGIVDTGATMADDVCAFAFLACEVFAGRSQFSDESVIAGVYSTLSGHRPARPDHPALSDGVWKMMKGCWRGNPAQRMTITKVVATLEAEANAHGP